MLSRLILVTIGLAVPFMAAAQTSSTTSDMNSEDIRSELYGVILEGTTGFEEFWTECIDSNGDTVYYFAGEILRGKMSLTDDGVICFDYEGRQLGGDNCFTARRSVGDQYLFFPADGFGNLFRTTRVIRGVDVCPEEAPALS